MEFHSALTTVTAVTLFLEPPTWSLLVREGRAALEMGDGWCPELLCAEEPPLRLLRPAAFPKHLHRAEELPAGQGCPAASQTSPVQSDTLWRRDDTDLLPCPVDFCSVCGLDEGEHSGTLV